MNRAQAKVRAKKNRSQNRQSGAVAPPSQGAAAKGTSGSDPKTMSRREAARQADRRRLRILLGIGTVALVAVIVAVALLRGQSNATPSDALTNPSALNPASQMLPVGSTAPDFDLATAGGQHYKLSDLRGHPVVLEFFAIWCPHCQNEAPILNQIDSAFSSKGEHTLSILASPYGRNYDSSGGIDKRPANKSDLTWFQDTFKVQHPMLVDPNYSTVNTYGANSYPTIYVIDSQGVIRFAQSGDVPYQDLANALNQLK